MTYHTDEHFRQFIGSLERAIDCYEGENDLAAQKGQVERLNALEIEWRRAVVRHRWGKFAYKDFLKLILDEKRNILMARPYFRERNQTFQEEISDVIRNREYRKLYQYHANYNFIQFVMESRKWHPNGKVAKTYAKIKALRNELVERNMPLAISEARLFWGKTPRSHLTYMDLVQLSADGLVSAIDKFCLPYSRVFRAVIIGRIRGNLIEAYSETYLHFYPADKRRLYRAHKAIGRMREQGHDYQEIANSVNRDSPDDHVTASEVMSLVTAAAVVSANALPLHEDEDEAPVNPIDRYPVQAAQNPDIMYEEHQARETVRQAIEELSVLEQKVLRLKGVEL